MAVGFRSTSNSGNAKDTTPTAPTVTVPAGVQAGDVVLLYLSIWTPGVTPTVTPPSGFAQVNSTFLSGDGAAENYVYWKRLTGSDAGSYTFTVANGGWWTVQAIAFTGVVSTGDPVGSQHASAAGTYGTYPTLNLTVGAGDGLAWFAYNDTGEAHTPPTGFTEAADVDCASTAYLLSAGGGAVSAANGSVASSSPAAAILVALATEPEGPSTGDTITWQVEVMRS